tara:strand:+ start:6325 stop:7074 length:750 start_codon:yes stop_codon:yes gene_type:complete
MAKAFYFDSVGLLEATINDGTLSSSSFSDGTTITNEERLIDQSISTAVSGFGNTDAFKITFSTSTSLDFIALYFSAAETDNMSFNRAVATNTFTSVANISTDFVAGWNITEFISASSTNWILSPTGDIANLTEMIVGAKLEFEVNPDVGIGEVNEFGTTINKSIGGVEYAVLNHETKNNLSFSFSSVSETFKDNLQSMESSVQNYKKFIYSENGTTGPFHYVRLDKPIQFKEVSSQRFSVNISLIEQLS